MNLLDLRFLWTFVVVAEEQSITKAAARLYLAQQTVSEQIRKLEHALGVELLSRGPRGVATTQAGRELAAFGQSLAVELEELVRRLRTIDADPS